MSLRNDIPATDEQEPLIWHVQPSDNHGVGLLIKPIPGDIVAEIDAGQEKYAPLIAAAPELYAEAKKDAAFLEQLAAHLEAAGMSGQAGNCILRVKAMRAAIAKAEGRTDG